MTCPNLITSFCQRGPSEGLFFDLREWARVFFRSGCSFSDHQHPVRHICCGDGVVHHPFQRAAQPPDGSLRALRFRLAPGGFHGKEGTAYLHQGQAQLTEDSQICHCPAHCQVKLLPVRLGKFLRPAMDAGDVAEAQGLPGVAYPGLSVADGLMRGLRALPLRRGPPRALSA